MKSKTLFLFLMLFGLMLIVSFHGKWCQRKETRAKHQALYSKHQELYEKHQGLWKASQTYMLEFYKCLADKDFTGMEKWRAKLSAIAIEMEDNAELMSDTTDQMVKNLATHP